MRREIGEQELPTSYWITTLCALYNLLFCRVTHIDTHIDTVRSTCIVCIYNILRYVYLRSAGLSEANSDLSGQRGGNWAELHPRGPAHPAELQVTVWDTLQALRGRERGEGGRVSVGGGGDWGLTVCRELSCCWSHLHTR